MNFNIYRPIFKSQTVGKRSSNNKQYLAKDEEEKHMKYMIANIFRIILVRVSKIQDYVVLL